MRAAALCACLALSGCVLAPDSLRIEAQHTSHLAQHFGGDWSHNQPGYDSVGVSAHWQRGHFYGDVGDYYTPECLDGSHEVFQARFGYEIPLGRGKP